MAAEHRRLGAVALEVFAWRPKAAALEQAMARVSAHPSAPDAIALAPDVFAPAQGDLAPVELTAQRLAPPEASAVAVVAAEVEEVEVRLPAAGQAEAAALRAGAAVLRQEGAARDAVAVPRQEAAARAGAAVRRREAAARDAVAVRRREVAALPRAVPPSALPSAWAFRRDPVLPWPAPQPLARSAHAMASLRCASP
jgi:hypothetical protein